jgi:hypothetical protein
MFGGELHKENKQQILLRHGSLLHLSYPGSQAITSIRILGVKEIAKQDRG